MNTQVINTQVINTYNKLRRSSLLLMIILIAGLNGCVTDPVTGGSRLSFLSRQDEINLGMEGDQQIVAQYGVYNDQAVADKVSQMGLAIAAKSDDPNYPYTFRVLNTPVINAFALPGGWVYVTRGLLAYLQNDAQLALVLGHEIGHVNAHHTARQYTKAQLANLAIGIGGAVFEEVRPFLGAVSTGLQLLFLKYSRDDEREADELGVRYATRSGYQASEGAKFFETLERIQDQQQGGALPAWQSTHPEPEERVKTVTERSAYWAQQTGIQLGGVNPQEYLPRLNNIVFGENPRDGFVQNGVYYHPELQFQFQVPSGWQYANFATQVQLAPQAGDAGIVFSATKAANPQTAAQQFVTDNQAQVIESSAITVNGLQAYRVKSNIAVDDGQGGTGTLTALSYFISKGNSLYIFHGYSEQSKFSGYATTFEGVFSSFATLTDQSKLNVQPYRVFVFTAPRTDQFQALIHTNEAAKMGLENLAIMNQVQATATITAGMPLKEVK